MRTARHRPRPGSTAAAPRRPAAAGSPPHAQDRAGSVTPTTHAHSLSSGAAWQLPTLSSKILKERAHVSSSAVVACHSTLAISTSVLKLERAPSTGNVGQVCWGSYRACARDGTGRLVLPWRAEGPAKVRRECGLQRVELRHVTHQQVQTCATETQNASPHQPSELIKNVKER